MRRLKVGRSFAFIIFIILSSVAHATILQVTEENITVNGKQSRVFAIKQPDGTFGYVGTKGEMFDVTVQNKTKVPLVLHWHGIIDPNPQDGVPYVTQYPIQAGASYHYHYPLQQAGTFWLHSHYKLQEQKLMAAPLILHEPEVAKQKQVVMFIQDFTFTDPKLIFARLRAKLQKHAAMDMSHHMTTPDVTDVKFDAYLTNQRTLQHPDVVRVVPQQTVRLRIINASASSNYYIDLGKLTGTLIAVDGAPIKPIVDKRFQISIGDRLDIDVQIPACEGAYPVLALPEGTRQQTGLVLATTNATVPTLSEKTQQYNPILNYDQELKTQALHPLSAHAVQRSLVFDLNGDMQTYRWTINGQEWPYIKPYQVQANERVELIFNNKSGMAHPMHLHGHVFQITEINGKKVHGRLGDTINVMPYTNVKVVLDMNNPGIWMLHCHVLYHQQGGMMTTINYAGYPNKFTTQQRVEGDKLY